MKLSKEADKSLTRKGRGGVEEFVRKTEEADLCYVRWFDSKVVNIISTFAKRYDQKNNCNVKIDCPDIISHYNKSMGGVDLADCLISLYRINIRSKSITIN